MISPGSEARMVNGLVARFMNMANGILEKRAFGTITGVAVAQQLANHAIQGAACRARALKARGLFNAKPDNEN
ncbi:hypothetical protein [Burkholderia sp. 22PA0106]|uniref:hypothetical protein n=1 Tax=Burkholderia sp. 22PA0106 TaxID=3237371 RepID=UPI0039C4454D